MDICGDKNLKEILSRSESITIKRGLGAGTVPPNLDSTCVLIVAGQGTSQFLFIDYQKHHQYMKAREMGPTLSSSGNYAGCGACHVMMTSKKRLCTTKTHKHASESGWKMGPNDAEVRDLVHHELPHVSPAMIPKICRGYCQCSRRRVARREIKKRVNDTRVVSMADDVAAVIELALILISLWRTLPMPCKEPQC